MAALPPLSPFSKPFNQDNKEELENRQLEDDAQKEVVDLKFEEDDSSHFILSAFSVMILAGSLYNILQLYTED